MSIELIWIIVLSISAPISGVVGFAISLRTIKKVRLQNEKLQLEIRKLKNEVENDSNIVIPTNDEVSRVIHNKSIAEYLTLLCRGAETDVSAKFDENIFSLLLGRLAPIHILIYLIIVCIFIGYYLGAS